ncbi:hypothetical protein J19TS2_03550 [Cohnella xylanilytica]|nr:hypothetical protein J19TS2_03550 [Cohnella xylanilytica]
MATISWPTAYRLPPGNLRLSPSMVMMFLALRISSVPIVLPLLSPDLLSLAPLSLAFLSLALLSLADRQPD